MVCIHLKCYVDNHFHIIDLRRISIFKFDVLRMLEIFQHTLFPNALDGVYYNPAGVVFLGEGHHLSLNWQLAYQTRIIKNGYDLFKNNVNNPITPREFKGEAFAPVIPSLQYAYNKGRWSFQANLALTGGGGKCTFDNGLGSFEKIVGETAMGACGLAGAVDGAAKGALGAAYPKNIFSEMYAEDLDATLASSTSSYTPAYVGVDINKNPSDYTALDSVIKDCNHLCNGTLRVKSYSCTNIVCRRSKQFCGIARNRTSLDIGLSRNIVRCSYVIVFGVCRYYYLLTLHVLRVYHISIL